jgi:hypothetical protein
MCMCSGDFSLSVENDDFDGLASVVGRTGVASCQSISGQVRKMSSINDPAECLLNLKNNHIHEKSPDYFCRSAGGGSMCT